MDYTKALNNTKNVRITSYSPRCSGETAKRSQWQEIELPYVFGFRERVALIKDAATNNSEVVIKTATAGGRARLFVRK